MKQETFFCIIGNDHIVVQSGYSLGECEMAKKNLKELALKHPGKQFHLMKRVSSAVALDIQWIDSD